VRNSKRVIGHDSQLARRKGADDCTRLRPRVLELVDYTQHLVAFIFEDRDDGDDQDSDDDAGRIPELCVAHVDRRVPDDRH
jgi:hypothetical protein